MFPPRTRSGCILEGPMRVIAGGLPDSYNLFFFRLAFLPPVALRLCLLSLDIPESKQFIIKYIHDEVNNTTYPFSLECDGNKQSK